MYWRSNCSSEATPTTPEKLVCWLFSRFALLQRSKLIAALIILDAARWSDISGFSHMIQGRISEEARRRGSRCDEGVSSKAR